MLWRMLRQSWGRNLRRKVLAIITVFLASSLISALLAVSIDIGDKMSRELKSYGANILIEPAGQAALPALFSESSNPLSGQDFLDEAELPNIKDIFWRNNIVGFAPMLGGEASVEGEPVRILGTFFSQPVDIPDEEGYETGQKTVSPYWQWSALTRHNHITPVFTFIFCLQRYPTMKIITRGEAMRIHRQHPRKAKRHCSLTIYQTICVGTRRYGFLTSQDEK